MRRDPAPFLHEIGLADDGKLTETNECCDDTLLAPLDCLRWIVVSATVGLKVKGSVETNLSSWHEP